MAPAHQNQNGARNEAASISHLPHPGTIHVSKQYLSQGAINQLLKENESSPAKEDNNRLEGIKMIEQVCKALQLPAKTYNAACTFYHKFRLKHKESEYNFHDASMACLVFACKVEDTIKKPKEILCTAYNLTHQTDQRTADDKMFDRPQGVIIGVERMVIETVSFDFRVRNPQKILVKVIKEFFSPDETQQIYPIAWKMSYDMYKTFTPIKQTSFSMALGLLELSTRLLDVHVDKVQDIKPGQWHTTRRNILETMIDILDLYTQHPKQTIIGIMFDAAKFIEVKIAINEQIEAAGFQAIDGADRNGVQDTGISKLSVTLADLTSNATGNDGQLNTHRFIFDEDEARQEMETTAEYFQDEYEETEVEVEETIPSQPRDRPRDHRGGHGRRHGGHGHGRHGPDGGWYGGGSGGHRNDRRRRGGGFF